MLGTEEIKAFVDAINAYAHTVEQLTAYSYCTRYLSTMIVEKDGQYSDVFTDNARMPENDVAAWKSGLKPEWKDIWRGCSRDPAIVTGLSEHEFQEQERRSIEALLSLIGNADAVYRDENCIYLGFGEHAVRYYAGHAVHLD